MTVLLVYELCVPPGRLDQVAALFSESYVPQARERGMELVGTYITPPIELDDAPTTLVYHWRLADAAAVWAMKRQVQQAPEIDGFWRTIDDLVVSRARRFLAPYKG